MNDIINKQKKAQEEIVGFVLIIIIVAIIVLVFLALSFRKSPVGKAYESEQIGSLLYSITQYTTPCAIGHDTGFLNIEELIKECQNQKVCINDKLSCEILNITLTNLLLSTLRTGVDQPVLGYALDVYFDDNLTRAEYVLINKGNCTINKKQAEYLIPSDLFMRLDVCYA